MVSAKVGVLAAFPGQGAQHVGMGKTLFTDFPVARETFEEASDAIRIDLKKLCFEGPDADLVLTENTQPALLTVSVAAFRVAEREFGFAPTLFAGHSLGEYSALVAARSLPLSTAARFVRARGLAMQTAVPAGEGGMCALLNLTDEAVFTLCKLATAAATELRRTGSSELSVPAVCEPANFNSPGQTVIAGSRDAIEFAVTILKEKAAADPLFKGGRAIPLAVSAPFHCSLMKPARTRMQELFSEAAAPHAPSGAYLPNRTANLTREPGLIYELLIDQIDHPVLWSQSMTNALKHGVHTLCEFGPGKVLQGLMKRIVASEAESAPGLKASLIGLADVDGAKKFEAALAAAMNPTQTAHSGGTS